MYDLLKIANEAMVSKGLEADFPPDAIKQLEGIRGPAQESQETIRDLTHLLWCSIDNDDSRDIDQVTACEKVSDGKIKIYVGLADVDAIVKKGTPIDQHAQKNTTSVYTGVKIFPMLPEKLSTDLTSLSQDEDRLALVIEMGVDSGGRVVESDIYRAKVKNRSKLAYNSVSAWLEGKGALPAAAAKVSGMDEQLKTQDRVAQQMRCIRHEHGALELETIEPRAVMKDGQVVDLKHEMKTRAGELIEDFMICANGVSARFLNKNRFPTLRRVVRVPKKWEKIVQVAATLGEKLPATPDSKALGEFLSGQRKRDPIRFPDLSLTIVKLLGAGEYVMEVPGAPPLGHFGLAVKDYSHSTAPNRRYPDLITHRLLKGAIQKSKVPYSNEELSSLALHCTQMEDAANKVERQVQKSAAALLLLHRIGEHFDGIVTGASDKGTFARVFNPPVEGMVVKGAQGLEVGDKVQLKLASVNVERGFIDFVRN